jgi:TPR repeat protein
MARLMKRAAEAGLPRAQFYYAALLQKGRGVRRDLASAHDWFVRAAEAGDKRAMAELATVYDLGLGVPSDAAKAQLWRARAQ